MSDAANEVLYEVADHIATITLNRPERMNTISGPMLRALRAPAARPNADRDVRVVILTGAGRAFCAGLDLGAQRPSGTGIGSAASDGADRPRPAQHPADRAARDRQADDLRPQRRRRRLRHGHRARLRHPHHGASRPSSPPPSPSAASCRRSGGTWLLPRLVGWSKAAEIIFTGRTLTRRSECLELGPRQRGRARRRADDAAPRAGAARSPPTRRSPCRPPSA